MTGGVDLNWVGAGDDTNVRNIPPSGDEEKMRIARHLLVAFLEAGYRAELSPPVGAECVASPSIATVSE